MDARTRTRLDIIERATEMACRRRREEDETHCAVFIKDTGDWVRMDHWYPCCECRDIAIEVHDEIYEEVLLVGVPA